MKATELFLKSLLKCGVSNIFGIVGGEAQAIRFDEVPGINFYLTRHEFTAGVMADVSARITKTPQVCYSTFGPGLTNLSTGVFSAIQDRSPILAVSAQIPSKEVVFNEVHQCLDNVGFMQPITKFAAEIRDISSIPQLVHEALQIAVDGIPGPVYLSFPLDVMMSEIDDNLSEDLLEAITVVRPKAADKANSLDLKQAIQCLAKAKKPLLIIGNQVIRDGVSKNIVAFAEALNIPTVCTLAAKGVFPEDHPLFVCTLNKYLDEIYKQGVIEQLFAEIDLVVLLGYDIGEDLKPNLWGKRQSLLINSHYNSVASVFAADYQCIGDISETLEAIRDQITGAFECQQTLQIKSILEKAPMNSKSSENTDIPFIVGAVRDAIGKDGILCSDIGLHKQYAGLLSKTYIENTFMCSNVCGTFGFGLPSAIAATLAMKNTDRRVALICGDGGFHSGSQDIETAVRYNLPFVIILLKDNEFGLIKYYQLLKGEKNQNAIGFGDMSFAKLAEANGAKGIELNSIYDLPGVLEQSFLSNEISLIEIPIKYDIELKEKF